MTLKKLYNAEKGRMKIAGFMSGKGSNLRKIIEHGIKIKLEKGRSPYEIMVIFSDKADSNANQIGKDYDIPVITRDLNGFYSKRGFQSTRFKDNPTIREEFDSLTLYALSLFNVDVIALGGYMSAITKPLLESFLIINVHPSDLSIEEAEKRKYTGDNAVMKAIRSKEKQIKSTTHIVEPKIDQGRILMISAPLDVKLLENFDYTDDSLVKTIANAYQDKLKESGDWIIFPKTLEFIANERYSQDEQGNLYFDNTAIPQGIKL